MSIKSITLSAMFSAIGAILLPLKAVYVTIFIVIMIDLFTGIRASRIKKVPINSRRARLSIKKMAGYFEVLFVLFIIEYGCDMNFDLWKSVAFFICIIEAISIIENIAIITEDPRLLWIIKLIRGRSKEKYGSLIDDMLNEKNNE